MADQQRIHPQDPEAPTAPLAPSFKSENGDPSKQHLPSRSIPILYSRPPKRKSCFCRCFCFTLCFILLLIIALLAAAGILYLVFRPKLPDYTVDQLRITKFDVGANGSVYARFDVRVTARNPNKRIGIYYRKGSTLSVSYSGNELCNGVFPEFYQGHRNTSVLDIPLTGRSQIGSPVMTSLQEQQQTGMVPLEFRARVPVRVKLGKLKLRKTKFRVRCRLVVDSLSANDLVRIRTSSCKFKFRP